MKLTVYNTGMSGFEVEGEITLTQHNTKTDDFEIRLERKKIHMVSSLPYVTNNDDWTWLKTYPIDSLELDSLTIQPVWSFNQYGEETDLNAFQTVTITDNEIILSVQAGGTHVDVFNRNLPYIDRQTGKEDNRTWQERERDTQNLMKAFNQNPVNPNQTIEKWGDSGMDANDVAKKLFE